MALKARLQRNAGNYRFRGEVWELDSFAYRAYVHLIPRVHLVPSVARSNLRGRACGRRQTMQEVLGSARRA